MVLGTELSLHLIPSISNLPLQLSPTPRAWHTVWNASRRHTHLSVYRLAAGTIPSGMFLLFISYSIPRAGSKFSPTPMALFLQMPSQRSGPNQIPGSRTTPLTGLTHLPRKILTLSISITFVLVYLLHLLFSSICLGYLSTKFFCLFASPVFFCEVLSYSNPLNSYQMTVHIYIKHIQPSPCLQENQQEKLSE